MFETVWKNFQFEIRCRKSDNLQEITPCLNTTGLFVSDAMLQDTSTADGAFSHAFKAYQLPTFSNDLFARD